MKSSLRGWLDSREPHAPHALAERMRAEIERAGVSELPVTPQALSDAGAAILKSLDQTGCSERSAALDLLAADALLTYAFEAASESKAEIEEATRYVLERVTAK